MKSRHQNNDTRAAGVAGRRLLAVALVLLATAMGWLVLREPRRPPARSPEAKSSPPSPAIPAVAVETALPSPPPAALPPAIAAQESDRTEHAATARMIAAHAPLRAPEVVDPDSTVNRDILQTMIGKALARPKQPTAPRPVAP